MALKCTNYFTVLLLWMILMPNTASSNLPYDESQLTIICNI